MVCFIVKSTTHLELLTKILEENAIRLEIDKIQFVLISILDENCNTSLPVTQNVLSRKDLGQTCYWSGTGRFRADWPFIQMEGS